MGMVINGVWSDTDQLMINGEFVRAVSTHNNEISKEVIDAIAKQPGRFHLIASWSCPWSHRAMLLRQLKGLEQHLPLHITGGKRLQGYPANFGNEWRVPGSEHSIVHLHQLYTLSDSDYTGRSTVPILWDSYQQKVVSNESKRIIRALDKVVLPVSGISKMPHFVLAPEHLLTQLEELNDDLYQNLSNAVYRAGFAEEQRAYDEAIEQVFATLNKLEIHLSRHRYLLGDVITEADWCLFPTLVRFDIDYYLHSRCSRRRLTDYPNVWAYTRELYSWPGIDSTINFDAIFRSNYKDDDVIPVLPDIDWHAPHNRAEIGPANLISSSGEKRPITASQTSQLARL